MSIDAMYWVWNHSRSKGTSRHVMLACANWITGPDCTVRASTAQLVRFSNAARSSVIKAVDDLLKSGELQLLDEARGTRAPLYRLPGAVGYVRPEGGSRGTDSGPLEHNQRSGNETPSARQGSENETPAGNARGPKTGPQGSENETPRGPETGPHNQNHMNQRDKDSSSAGSSAAAEKNHHLEAFGAFWFSYPKKKAREEAKKAWIAAIERGADPARIVDAATAYARERNGEDPKYTKYPATWLNKGCYDDEPDPQPKPQPGNGIPQHNEWTMEDFHSGFAS